ncbi:MAG: anti-sigma factor [Alphaproteobacteria bacterium]|nr:anti-sigma factor [Alphaproteobacteria bacterium]
MSEQRQPIADDVLHALADGRLDPARAAEATAALADRPEDARRVADYQRINAALHAQFDPVLAEPLPERLTRRPRAAWHRRPWARVVSAVAASALLVTIGGVGGWYARDAATAARQEQSAMVRPAALAHRIYVAEVRHPVEVRAEEEHLVRWLSSRLKIPLKTPKLDDKGFRLMGGRLLPTDRGNAAQFMYEDTQGRRLTLYIRSDLTGNRETAFRYAQDDSGVGMFYWIDGPRGYAITAQMPREELLNISKKIYEDLEG